MILIGYAVWYRGCFYSGCYVILSILDEGSHFLVGLLVLLWMVMRYRHWQILLVFVIAGSLD
jgi:hypothetical protein